MQSQAIYIPRELLSLHEEVDMSLDGLHVNGKFFMASIYYEIHFRTAILTDGVENNMIMKAADIMFQVCYKCIFHVVTLHCDKQFKHVVDE